MTPSDYQQASQSYYGSLREAHTGVYSSAQRMQEETGKVRYTHVNPPELAGAVANLGSFIKVLHGLLASRQDVRGIDFGCGSHWFVDYVRGEFGWNVTGYDPDELAIKLACQRFPNSADFYRCADPMQSGLPAETASQDFVFCNAVLQHFDDEETQRAIAEMARVLRPGGYCMLIFKHWTDELLQKSTGMDQAPQFDDVDAGKVSYFDPTMKREIDKLTASEKNKLEDHTRQGWRLFHLLRIGELVELASQFGLKVAEGVPVGEERIRGVITYRSGKKFPTACVVLSKD